MSQLDVGDAILVHLKSATVNRMLLGVVSAYNEQRLLMMNCKAVVELDGRSSLLEGRYFELPLSTVRLNVTKDAPHLLQEPFSYLTTLGNAAHYWQLGPAYRASMYSYVRDAEYFRREMWGRAIAEFVGPDYVGRLASNAGSYPFNEYLVHINEPTFGVRRHV